MLISVTSRMIQTGVHKRKSVNSVDAWENVERGNIERGNVERGIVERGPSVSREGD